MPIVNGVGYGDHSAAKQDDFRSLLSLHIDLVDQMTSEANKQWKRYYTYIDMNAGPGCYNGLTGSPLVFLDKIEKTSIPYRGIFIEQESENANALGLHLLERNIRGYAAVLNGNHELVMRGGIKPDGFAFDRPTFGLVYHDPSGSVPAFDLLAEVSHRPEYKYMEFMVYLSATNIKRVRRFEEAKDGAARVKLLTEYLRFINKSTWIIRKPQGKHQWTFLIGSDWRRYPDWKSRGFYRVDSPEGQSVLKHLTYTTEEIDAMSGQQNFDFFDQPDLVTHLTGIMPNT